MNLKTIMLSERCQIQKTKNCMIPLVWNIEVEPIRGVLGVAAGITAYGLKGILRSEGNVLKLDCGDDYTPL